MCITSRGAERVRRKLNLPSRLPVCRSLFAAPLTRLLAASHRLLTLCSPASEVTPRCGCPLQSLSLYTALVHFLNVSRTKEEFYFCKANHCPSTVSLSAKKHPLYRRHPGTCSRLAGRKRCVCTLESEKTYSFRCVFSFSVSSTITSLLGTFWDLISCKTEQRPGVMSCSHRS